jgi:hypothetical protein
MSFLSFFGKIGHALSSPATAKDVQIAASIAAPFSPGIGSLVETIAGAVYSVESAAAAGTPGASKKAQAQSIIDVAAPVATTVLDSIAGKSVDPSSVAPVLNTLIDDVVTLFHLLGVFTKSSTAATAAEPAAAPVAAVTPAAVEPVIVPVIPAGVPSAHL